MSASLRSEWLQRYSYKPAVHSCLLNPADTETGVAVSYCRSRVLLCRNQKFSERCGCTLTKADRKKSVGCVASRQCNYCMIACSVEVQPKLINSGVTEQCDGRLCVHCSSPHRPQRRRPAPDCWRQCGGCCFAVVDTWPRDHGDRAKVNRSRIDAASAARTIPATNTATVRRQAGAGDTVASLERVAGGRDVDASARPDPLTGLQGLLSQAKSKSVTPEREFRACSTGGPFNRGGIQQGAFNAVQQATGRLMVDPIIGYCRKRAGTSLCACLYTRNIRKRQVHFQSLDSEWTCLSIIVSRTTASTGEVPETSLQTPVRCRRQSRPQWLRWPPRARPQVPRADESHRRGSPAPVRGIITMSNCRTLV